MTYFTFTKQVLRHLPVFIIVLTALFSGCGKKDKEDSNLPPVIVPDTVYKSNISIDSLKKYYFSASPHSGIDTLKITQDFIIQGIVNSTDESGNIYKSLFIQDNSGGIVLGMDQFNLYTQFKIGQKVFIKCKGLYMGTYGGAVEIGYGVYNYMSIGRIPQTMIASHIFRDSLPGKPPTPVVIDPRSNTIGKYLYMLVEVPNVRWPDAGQPFITGGATTNRNVGDSLGYPIMNGNFYFVIRTSNYSNFSYSLLPYGVGTLRGILNNYMGQFQITVRDLNDLVNYEPTAHNLH